MELKTMRQKEKALIICNFSFCHNVLEKMFAVDASKCRHLQVGKGKCQCNILLNQLFSYICTYFFQLHTRDVHKRLYTKISPVPTFVASKTQKLFKI